MANKKAPNRALSGEQLAKATAEKVFGWKNVRKHDGELAAGAPLLFTLELSRPAFSPILSQHITQKRRLSLAVPKFSVASTLPFQT